MLFRRRGYDVPVYMPSLTDEDLNIFAGHLYEYLYHKLNMKYSYRYKGPNLRVIGDTVLLISNSARDFNRAIMDKFRFCGSKESLCQNVCDSYPNRAYFKKLFYVSAFILELVCYWDEGEELGDYSLGPTLWKTIFRKNFASEFEKEGAWSRFRKIANIFHRVPPSEMLLRQKLLPETLEGVFLCIRELYPSPEQSAVDEAIASLQRLEIGTMEENQPEALEDIAGPSGLCGNTAQTGHLGARSSGQFGDDVSHNLGDRNPRKRSHDVPSKTDSDEKSDSPIPSKALKEECDVSRNLVKRKHDSPPKSDSDREPDSVSPSQAKERKMALVNRGNL